MTLYIAWSAARSQIESTSHRRLIARGTGSKLLVNSLIGDLPRGFIELVSEPIVFCSLLIGLLL